MRRFLIVTAALGALLIMWFIPRGFDQNKDPDPGPNLPAEPCCYPMRQMDY